MNQILMKGGMNIAQIIHHWCDTHTYAFLRTKHTLLEDNPNVKMYEVDEFLSTADSNTLDVKDSLNIIEGIHSKWAGLKNPFRRRKKHIIILIGVKIFFFMNYSFQLENIELI